MNDLKTKEENPKGLHKKYFIQKYAGKKYIRDNFYGEPVYEPVFKDVEDNAEYFVLRLDTNGGDIEHTKACRIGINAYADAIEIHLPELAADLRERYPIIS